MYIKTKEGEVLRVTVYGLSPTSDHEEVFCEPCHNSSLQFPYHGVIGQTCEWHTETKPAASPDEEIINQVTEESIVQCILENDKEYFIPIDLANHLSKIFDQQFIQPLQNQLKEVKEWKRQAIEVMADFQAIGRAINVPLGQSVHDKILPTITSLQSEVERLSKENEEAIQQRDYWHQTYEYAYSKRQE